MSRLAIYLCALLALSAAPAAVADTLTLYGMDNGSLTFDLPSQPTPDDYSSGQYFTTHVILDDFGYASIGFANVTDPGNILVDAPLDLMLAGNFGFLYFTGDQLYSGDESSPTLLRGTFALTSVEGENFTLTIADTSPVPEGSTLLYLGTGMTSVAALYRRRLAKA
jgi:hypothetical protein